MVADVDRGLADGEAVEGEAAPEVVGLVELAVLDAGALFQRFETPVPV